MSTSRRTVGRGFQMPPPWLYVRVLDAYQAHPRHSVHCLRLTAGLPESTGDGQATRENSGYTCL